MTTEPSAGPAQPLADSALVIVDVQVGFDDPVWGTRNNPAFEGNLQQLLDAWTAAGLPLVYVRHDSSEADSPLHPDRRGNELQGLLASASPDLLVTKQVN